MTSSTLLAILALAAAAAGLAYAVLLRRRLAELAARNAELEARAEDLAASNAELAARAEELAARAEELARARDAAESGRAQLQQAQAELVNSARLATLGMLVAGIAHELNTPMGALRSNHQTFKRALERLAAILEDEVVDETELDELRRIVRAVDGVMSVNDMAVDRMLQIIGSLRTFGRVDRSERDRVDLRDGLESTLALLRHELKDRIEVVRDYGETPPVECYPHQLNQVFMNLVLNAAQAIRERGTITVRTRAVDDAVRIEIQDTGAGIPDEHRGRIFEPGFTTKGNRVGMGLGLLISRQIVDRHHGRIEVESEVGKGTTFAVTVPVRMAAEAEAEAEAGARGESDAAGDAGPISPEAAKSPRAPAGG